METDERLVEKTLEGDGEAFEMVIDRYSVRIHSFMSRLIGRREEVTDLVQDVFLKAWTRLDSFSTDRSFQAWIFSIARNTAIDWLRKKKDLAFSRTADDYSAEESLVDPEPLPDEVFERKELARDLELSLNKLSPEARSIILLHLSEDMTFEEIALILEKPMNTVKSNYRRALIKLREFLV